MPMFVELYNRKSGNQSSYYYRLHSGVIDADSVNAWATHIGGGLLSCMKDSQDTLQET